MNGRDIVSLTCKELVELVTEYQCDALALEDRATFEQHLFGCTWCMTYLKQMDRAIELTAQLREPVNAPPADPGKLTALFRGWRDGAGRKRP
jgi:hypothetical protein